MIFKKARAIRYASAAAAVLLSATVLSASANAGDRTVVYHDRTYDRSYDRAYERSWSAEPRADRIFRDILRSLLKHQDTRPHYRPHRRDVKWAKPHRRHVTHEVCRIKKKVVYDRNGNRKKITRKKCHDLRPQRHHWRR